MNEVEELEIDLQSVRGFTNVKGAVGREGLEDAGSSSVDHGEIHRVRPTPAFCSAPAL